MITSSPNAEGLEVCKDDTYTFLAKTLEHLLTPVYETHPLRLARIDIVSAEQPDKAHVVAIGWKGNHGVTYVYRNIDRESARRIADHATRDNSSYGRLLAQQIVARLIQLEGKTHEHQS